MKNCSPGSQSYKYQVGLRVPVSIVDPGSLTTFEKAFWGIISSRAILDIITKLYNDPKGIALAKRYIRLLERMPAFKGNVVIYRYLK